MNGAFGLDFPAVIQMASLGATTSPRVAILLAEALPSVEQAVIASLRKADEE